eukprot:TRINITY_DN66646_c1_g1_i6.p1 TRINITY_DN66646_c1_g1~~TRINITY_DN66646_c1_g1_i6.p1  ORF type:complete len:120 (+),score=32.30 TRINITY_DN66646_c1_g1_i6:33-362(+)
MTLTAWCGKWDMKSHLDFPEVFRFFCQVAVWCLQQHWLSQQQHQTTTENDPPPPTKKQKLGGDQGGTKKEKRSAPVLPLELAGCVFSFWATSVFSPRLLVIHSHTCGAP